MKNQKFLSISSMIFLGALIFAAPAISAQEKQKRQYIQAIAQGTSQQLGTIVSVNLIINEFSTPDDQKALIEAFQEDGSKGVANALDKMSAKGRISITGTLGYDVNYIREFKMPDGSRKIRIVTDRPISFREHWASGRSTDYQLSAAEIIISAKKGENVGTLLPACQFKIDKENELQIETFQNPWKLVNVKLSK